ncbi:MAG TPA: 2OG-Fe(II) oxygenase [Caulobacteraceae bacterium]|jgi:Rps23 Pro-64 3,4-dihydroxylase Tpa1-like proline 4-hydroxylase
MSPTAAPLAVFDEFLAPMELGWAHDLVARQRSAFQASQVIGDNDQGVQDPGHRRSHVLYDLGVFHQLMTVRLAWFFPHIVYRLGIPAFAITQVELQLTSSGEGEFFRPHTDNDNGPVRGRAITFVLFCHREPPRFSGGQLRLYGRDPGTGAALMEEATVVTPLQNRMVLFPSDRLHEVTPVACPSHDILDTRLTLNGWLHR